MAKQYQYAINEKGDDLIVTDGDQYIVFTASITPLSDIAWNIVPYFDNYMACGEHGIKLFGIDKITDWVDVS